MKWYEIKDKGEKAEVWIYEEIGEDFWSGGGITAKNFQKELSAIKASEIDLHINSPGGVVFDGITIYNLLKGHKAKITTYIDGLAASIASVIALAGEKVVMAENALWMMHNPQGFAIGSAADMRSTADVLDKIRDSMTVTYTGKSGQSTEEINALLEAETWMTAAEAKEAGFVDEIAEEMDLAACAKFVPFMAKMKFKHIPRDLSGMKEVPSERDLEHILRDAGCSLKEAKAILARGYAAAALRDADQGSVPPKAKTPPRDAEPPKPANKDRFADLLIRAERAAPSA